MRAGPATGLISVRVLFYKIVSIEIGYFFTELRQQTAGRSRQIGICVSFCRKATKRSAGVVGRRVVSEVRHAGLCATATEIIPLRIRSATQVDA